MKEHLKFIDLIIYLLSVFFMTRSPSLSIVCDSGSSSGTLTGVYSMELRVYCSREKTSKEFVFDHHELTPVPSKTTTRSVDGPVEVGWLVVEK